MPRKKGGVAICDPPSKTEPSVVGDLGPRGSVCPRLAGTIMSGIVFLFLISARFEGVYSGGNFSIGQLTVAHLR
jgi:hypothetical protein